MREADERVANQFLRELIEDRAAGRTPGLEDYVRRFPGHGELIRTEYSRMHREDTGSGRVSRDSLTAGDFAAPPGVGSQVGSYVIEEELGRGGQATVYRARDTRLRREVALKVLRASNALGNAIGRFHREAEAASRLDHPAICPVYEIGSDAGVAFIAMRYIRGTTLAQQIADARNTTSTGATPSLETSRPDRVPVILRWFAEIAEALETAHQHGILHRDIKPANLMISDQGGPVVLDFGLAADESSSVGTLTESGDALGTPAYMAPEQIRGARATPATDVFGVGVSLYEALTLERPFRAATRDGLYHAILDEEPTNPRRHAPGIPPDLAAVIEVALTKEPNRRYGSAGALADDLRNVLDGRPVGVKPASTRTRVLRWARRHPGTSIPLAVTLVVLVAGLVWTLIKNREITLSLEEITRLSDIVILRELEERASALWPAVPERVDALRTWIRDADDVLARAAIHRSALENVRASALPYGEPERRADHAAELRRITELEEDRSTLQPLIDNSPYPHEKKYLGGRLRRTEERLAVLRDLVGSAHEWRFDHPGDDWRHSVLAELVALLDKLERPHEGTMASIRERLEFAENLKRRTVDELAAAWEQTLDYVRGEPRYRDLAELGFTPQVGLVPLGPDPESGLLEFLHLATHRGDIAARDSSGRLRRDERTGVILVLVPGGTFWMGAQPEDPGGPNYAESIPHTNVRPVHRATVSPLFISKHELTQAQWLVITGENPMEPPGDSEPVDPGHLGLIHPIAYVSWNSIAESLPRVDLALPTEPQWEYACRAGTETNYYCGATAGSLQGHANIADVTAGRKYPSGFHFEEALDDGWIEDAPTGSFAANPFGLHDVHGNVAEFCLDSFEFYGLQARDGDRAITTTAINPLDRVVRGGASALPAFAASSSARTMRSPDSIDKRIGCRPVRPIRR